MTARERDLLVFAWGMAGCCVLATAIAVMVALNPTPVGGSGGKYGCDAVTTPTHLCPQQR